MAIKTFRLMLSLALIAIFYGCGNSSATQQNNAVVVHIVQNYPNNTNLLLDEAQYAPDAINQLIESAENNISIEVYYVSNKLGSIFDQKIYQPLKRKASQGVKVKILVNAGSPNNQSDLNDLASTPNITVVSSNWFSNNTGGIIHEKAIMVDGKKFYLGSHNFDWITFELNHELGVISNDANMTNALMTVFENDWFNATNDVNSTLSYTWSAFQGMYQLGVSPQFNGLEWDNNKLISLMNSAKTQINMQAMTINSYDTYEKQYWNDFKNAIINAAKRGVKVKMMASNWEFQYVNSTGTDSSNAFLQELLNPSQPWSSNIEIKISSYPLANPCVPYSEVDHAKYMIIDNNVWVSTANLGMSYFYTTRDVSFYGYEDLALSSQLQSIFNTMWNSQYTQQYLFSKPWTTPTNNQCTQ